MDIKISVVIVTYNRGGFIEAAIQSVLSQNFSFFELIIIDDASADNTAEIICPYLSDERIVYHKINKCKTISEARNAAWSLIRGQYIAVLDSDDIWSDSLKLEKQFNYLESNLGTILVGGGAILIDNNNNELGVDIKPENDDIIKKDFFVKNPFYHSSVMYRFTAIEKVGGYDENISFGEDLDLWLRLGEIGELHNIAEALIKYRVHDDNESKKHWFRAIKDVLKIIKKNRKTYKAGKLVFAKKILNKFKEFVKF